MDRSARHRAWTSAPQSTRTASWRTCDAKRSPPHTGRELHLPPRRGQMQSSMVRLGRHAKQQLADVGAVEKLVEGGGGGVDAAFDDRLVVAELALRDQAAEVADRLGVAVAV